MQSTQRTHPSRHGESFIVKSPATEDNKCLGMRGLEELVVRYSIADESDIPKRKTWPHDDASRLSVVPLYLEAEHPLRCYDRYNLGLERLDDASAVKPAPVHDAAVGKARRTGNRSWAFSLGRHLLWATKGI